MDEPIDSSVLILQMEEFMQDKPLPNINALRGFEKRYLSMALEPMMTELRRDFVFHRDKNQRLKEAHDDRFGDFVWSTAYRFVRLRLELANERYVDLLHGKWDWNAYFIRHPHDYDLYVRWFFI